MRRDEANRIVISNPEECYHCKNSISLDDNKCRICDFPQKGSQEDMRRFVWQKRKEKRDRKEAQQAYVERIRKARWISFALAVLFLVGFVFETDIFKLFDLYVYAFYVIFIISFFASGMLMLKYPRVCASISLGLYLFWVSFQAVLDIGTLSQGALLKVIFIAGLVYGVKEAFLNRPPSIHNTDLNILDEEFLSN